MIKKIIVIISIIIGMIIGGGFSYFILYNQTNQKSEVLLPEPELSEGLRGVYGIDKNINESTIDNYLYRTDTVYRDVRMLEDTATWENKGGDRYLSGYIKGFEIIPAVYLTSFTDEYIKQKQEENISGLYVGPTLFSVTDEGGYKANYEESMDILEAIFPKDKNIFIMCGAGGYAKEVKDMLVSLGWNSKKIRNIGGYWYYKGKNSIQVKEEKNDKDYYNFSKVPYYNIDFNTLHEVK